MPECHITECPSKLALFGRSQLDKARPFHGVKLRWKDRVEKDMSCLSILGDWYKLPQDKKCWYDLCHEQMNQKINRRIEEEGKKCMAGTASHPTSIFEFNCDQCQRTFRRSGYLKRYKCDSKRSRRGRAPQTSVPEIVLTGTAFNCQNCGKTFRRQGDLKRHKCHRT